MSEEITPLRCKKSNREFAGFQVVTIGGIANLLSGGSKIFRLELVCLHCGTVNYWNARESEMSKQTEVFIELLAKLQSDKTD